MVAPPDSREQLARLPPAFRRKRPAPIALVVAALILILPAGCRRGERPPSDTRKVGKISRSLEFQDVTADSGIRFTYRNGRESDRYTILESLGGGCGLLDYDGDGYLDAFLPGGGRFLKDDRIAGHASGLFRNQGDARFVDVSEQARVNPPRGYTHGVAAADFDNDGFSDILVTGYGALQLLRNQGDGTFQDVTGQAGLEDSAWSTGAGWGDFDGDGNLDLYVAHYVDWSFANDPRCPRQPNRPREICSPLEFEGLRDGYYRGRGDGTFVDWSSKLETNEPGKGLGVLVADLDSDGSVEVYVANDTSPNFLFRNEGDGRLSEVGQRSGVALDAMGGATGSMGVDVGDFNSDGMADIGVANYDSEMFGLYRQSGGVFTPATAESGLASLGTTHVGWGTAFVDLDHDGDEDLVVVNGHVLYRPENSTARQRPLVLLNHQHKFQRVDFPPSHYLGQPHHARGLAVGDLNHDGLPDLMISHNNEPVRVLLNRSPSVRSWCLLRFIGRRAPRDAIGTTVETHSEDVRQTCQVKGSSSYLSQSDRRILLAADHAAGPLRLSIRWPGGRIQRLELSGDDPRRTILEPRDDAGD